ncbi:MAG: Wzz/FepE/Etk N-terminal domain-containing protein [Thiohalorhabdus sp.]|uniref:Wzz/FepE/Etk N-terminal domain-containing protein n=1 Tax=Thiohalorhabdus sp. TaxID=3094134 RepID=UPI0039802A81
MNVENRREHVERAAEDEIDLADLAGVLYRQRWLIFGGTAAVFLLALAFSLLQPAKYQVESYLRVGTVGEDHIADPESVAAQMKSLGRVVGEDVFQQDDREIDYETGWSVEAQGGGVIRARIPEAVRADAYAEFLEAVNQQVIEEHNTMLEERRSWVEEEAARVEATLEDLRERRSELADRMDQRLQGDGAGPGGDQQLMALRDLYADVGTQISERESRLSELQAELSNLQPTKMLLAPRFSEDPVSPNTRLNLALGLVLGLFLSVFLAFLAEFWRNNRQRIVQGEGG